MRSFIIGLLGIIFLCGFTGTLPTTKFQDSRDGIRYAAVSIGDLQIMTNNLQFQNETSYCYENLDRYCKHFGKLYNYDAVIDEEGNPKKDVCPKGWKVPTLADWEYLISGMKPAIKRDKKGERIYHVSENYAQLQFSGFRSHQGSFYFNMGKEGHYLTATTTDNGWATVKVRRQGKGYDLIILKDTDKNRAVSCRCVKDK